MTLDVPGSADPAEGHALEDLQQLDLEVRAHLPDLVEEEASPIGELEQPLLADPRVGEGPLLVAEELGLEQLARNRRAVDLEEGPVGERAHVVDVAGDHLLARAALALDQHARRVAHGHLLRDLVDGADRRRNAPHEVAGVTFLLVPAVVGQLAERAGRLERLDAQDAEFLEIERLGQEVVCAGLHRGDGGLDLPEGGHDDDRAARVPARGVARAS